MKYAFLLTALLAALAVSPASAALPAALPAGQVLTQGDTSVILVPEPYLAPGLIGFSDQYPLQHYGLMLSIQSTRANAAQLQIRALIETSDGIRKWYRLDAPYKLPASGISWVTVYIDTGANKVTAVYGLKVTVIDAGQEAKF